jgi:hypothetical protein
MIPIKRLIGVRGQPLEPVIRRVVAPLWFGAQVVRLSRDYSARRRRKPDLGVKERRPTVDELVVRLFAIPTAALILGLILAAVMASAVARTTAEARYRNCVNAAHQQPAWDTRVSPCVRAGGRQPATVIVSPAP